jgi:S-adenosylmethionine hydrolase
MLAGAGRDGDEAMAMRRSWTLLLAAALLLAAPLARAAAPNGIIVYETDFGLRDGAVASMKGVALAVEPTLRLFDLTHEIPPFDIWTGAYQLDITLPYWPPGTVFVVVVDPGVGTERAAIVARTGSGHYVVTPDNGTLTLVADRLGLEAVHRIDEARHRLPGSEASFTFHGRDLFSITAARLASGAITLEQVGPRLATEPVRLDYQAASVAGDALVGTIPALDVNFGNVWTNIEPAAMAAVGLAKGDLVAVRILEGADEVYRGAVVWVDTFGDVPEGEALLYRNSVGTMALAINYGDFAATHGIGFGAEWRVELRRIRP